jgi:SAM-dependent methyltransferase
MSRRLVRIYRTGDDYRRYSWDSTDRRRSLASFYRAYQRYIGKRVLDLCCGGGVLGRILEPSGRKYLGIDANPDMIREAQKSAAEVGSKQQFVLGDVMKHSITGKFDTITLIGNSLAHFTVRDMDELLDRRRTNVHRGSTFLVDYRDLIGMFWHGTWSRVKIQTYVRGKIVHRARLVDLESGQLQIRARPSSRDWLLDWAHAIWSPFILEAVMRSHGWQLVNRAPAAPQSAAAKLPEHHVEVYRLEPRRPSHT